jgi:hypothetical protein
MLYEMNYFSNNKSKYNHKGVCAQKDVMSFENPEWHLSQGSRAASCGKSTLVRKRLVKDALRDALGCTERGTTPQPRHIVVHSMYSLALWPYV